VIRRSRFQGRQTAWARAQREQNAVIGDALVAVEIDRMGGDIEARGPPPEHELNPMIRVPFPRTQGDPLGRTERDVSGKMGGDERFQVVVHQYAFRQRRAVIRQFGLLADQYDSSGEARLAHGARRSHAGKPGTDDHYGFWGRHCTLASCRYYCALIRIRDGSTSHSQ